MTQTDEEKLQNQKDADRRGFVWYLRYYGIAHQMMVNQCQFIPSIMRSLHETLNAGRCFGYEHIAKSAGESLELALRDLGLEP